GFRRAVGARGQGRAAPARRGRQRDPVLEPRHRGGGAAVRRGRDAAARPRGARAGACGLGRRPRHDVAARARVPRAARGTRAGVAMKRGAWALALLLALPARAGLIEPPPALVAMWDGTDGASVRVALLGYAALGEARDASARQKLESGEAAWWLGVQD